MSSSVQSQGQAPPIPNRTSSAASPQKPNIPKIGPYVLSKTLGVGSTGRVKLGTHHRTGQRVAIKIIPKTHISNGQSHNLSRKIEREITIMKLIQHPNVMALYDVYETNDELYLVLEHVEGGELFDYLVKKGRLDEREALNFFQQIIYGLDFCHKHQICHRDLKPENLLLDANFNIKIADFGMASLQQTGKMLETSCGSPHYASPEIIRGIKYDGAAADIWSCGVILYALLSGNLPFDDENIRRLLSKVKTGVYYMPTHISENAQDLIRRMLQTDPTKRMKMEEIFQHPWFVSQPPKHKLYPPISENILKNKPVPEEMLDQEIIKSLMLLGWTEEAGLKQAIASPEPNAEKIFYHLLHQRSQETVDNWQEEEDEFQDQSLPRRRNDSHASLYSDKPRYRSESSLHSSSGNLLTGSTPTLNKSSPDLNNNSDGSEGGERDMRSRTKSTNDAHIKKRPQNSPLRETAGPEDMAKLNGTKPSKPADPAVPTDEMKRLSITIPAKKASDKDNVLTPKFHRRRKDESVINASPSPIISTPKKSWFANLFNFNRGQVLLPTIKPSEETIEAVLVKLKALDVKVQEGRHHGLKCKYDEIESTQGSATQLENPAQSPVVINGVKKSIKFRVEILDSNKSSSSSSPQSPTPVMVQFILQQGPPALFNSLMSKIQAGWSLNQ